MPKLTFTRDFDKALPFDEVKGQLAIHYQAGHAYDVPDDLVAEVAAFVEGAAPQPIAEVASSPEPAPEAPPAGEVHDGQG